MAFEEEFGSEISDSEAEKILTVGDAIKFIESKSLKQETFKMNHMKKILGGFIFSFVKANDNYKNSTKIPII